MMQHPSSSTTCIRFVVCDNAGMTTMSTPTHANVSYGPHELQNYDFWKAGEGVTPLFVFIHGGGWTGGDKHGNLDVWLRLFLEAGISFATVEYRPSTMAPLPAPVEDAGRAIQHLRAYAADYGIDPARVGAYGGSAGACTAMNLALGPDMADPASDDLVARQSSRPSCAGGKDGQTAIEVLLLKEWLGEDILKHRMPNRAVGEESAEALLANYAQHRPMLERFSPILQVREETAVPIFMEYTPRNGLAIDLPAQGPGAAIHHSEMGRRLKTRMDELGLECHLVIRDQDDGSVTRSLDFFKAKLLSDSLPPRARNAAQGVGRLRRAR